jgi:shikimate dehydrogenase
MKRYGLIGKTLGYSFSKTFFERFFQENNIEAVFENIEIPSISVVDEVLRSAYSGLCVTIPYKESIIPFLDELSDEARSIGAVNVVKFTDRGCVGYNTDAFGFQQSIKPFLTNQHERAIILGTGGASKSVAFVLKNLGIDVLYISRNPSQDSQFSYEAINEHMIRACKLIVNTTPVGTFPQVDEFIELPFQELTTEHLVVDLVYNPPQSMLLKKAQEAGAVILNGQSMLEQQALKAWEVWGT